MSWWISLEDPNIQEYLEAPHHEGGGTHQIGGCNECELNVTYNYGKHFEFKKLDECEARNTIEMLKSKVEQLGTERDSDYWAPTKGNVGYCLNVLLSWAELYPNGIWSVR